MSICHQRKLIFVHIPKNAGTSIHSLFNTNPKDYLPDQKWIVYKNHFQKYWNTYTKFSIVRHPISRMISIYKYCKNNNIGSYLNNISDFVENICEVETPIKNSQSWFICENNTTMVDKIIKYEDLENGLESIGITNIPHKNKSYLNEKVILSKKLTLKIENLYQDDYENFKYTY